LNIFNYKIVYTCLWFWPILSKCNLQSLIKNDRELSLNFFWCETSNGAVREWGRLWCGDASGHPIHGVFLRFSNAAYSATFSVELKTHWFISELVYTTCVLRRGILDIWNVVEYSAFETRWNTPCIVLSSPVARQLNLPQLGDLISSHAYAHHYTCSSFVGVPKSCAASATLILVYNIDAYSPYRHAENTSGRLYVDTDDPRSSP